MFHVRVENDDRKRLTWIALLWYFVPFLSLFVASLLLGVSLHLKRYLAWQLPGLALIYGIYLSQMQSKLWRNALLVTIVTLFVFERGELALVSHEGWCAAAKAIDEAVSRVPGPVLVSS